MTSFAIYKITTSKRKHINRLNNQLHSSDFELRISFHLAFRTQICKEFADLMKMFQLYITIRSYVH